MLNPVCPPGPPTPPPTYLPHTTPLHHPTAPDDAVSSLSLVLTIYTPTSTACSHSPMERFGFRSHFSSHALTIFLVLCLVFATTTNAHNITRMLAELPEFSTFNHYLTVTHLAAEINRRQTITVLAVDNAGMSDILSKHLSLPTLKNVLSLHVLVDYYGAKKLHQITDGTTLTSTIFQASGAAAGTSGFVNITDLKAGKVGFGTEDGELTATFVKSIKEIPYYISVLQISKILTSQEAEAPVAAPSLNLTDILNMQGCKAFADLLKATGAEQTFDENVDGGLTVFCPSDAAIRGFASRYKNLTAAKKTSLLLYHGFPVYYSLQMLKSNNGKMNTLATDGKQKYALTVQTDGEDVKLETEVVTATITGTVKDEEPLVVYKIDKVLQPTELFDAGSEPDDEAAPAPKASKKAKSKAKGAADDGDAEAPADDSEDTTADEDNAAAKLSGGKLVATVLFALCLRIF
uniref:FAS1 domain-containing protein n=1 Tax=Kalanchoe fedtschenkoi TaxID=63787 RepID=A0A7N0RIT9_KALFE